MSLTRRDLLRLAGGTLAAAPFVGVRSARAGGGDDAPKRLVVFHHSQGTVLGKFVPGGLAHNFTLPYLLQPLEAFKDQMVVLTGLDNVMPELNSAGDSHENANGTLFTARPFYVQDDDAITGGGPSFEDGVADLIGADTPFRRLDLGVGGRFQVPSCSRFYRGPYDPIVPMTDPVAAIRHIFGDDTLSEAEALQIRDRRTRVLDAVARSFEAMHGRVPATERARLDAHREKLDELNARIGAELPECLRPQPDLPTDYDADDDDDLTVPVMNDVLVAALRCDYTRVATLQFLNDNDHPFDWLTAANGGQPIVDTSKWDDWHTMCHADFQPGMELVFRWYMECFADLLHKMAATEDVDGDNLLDTSLVLYMPEFSSGRHWSNAIPAILVGRCGEAKMGRWLDHMGGTVEQLEQSAGRMASNATTNQLFASILRVFGSDETSFGEDAGPRTRGVLDKLFA